MSESQSLDPHVGEATPDHDLRRFERAGQSVTKALRYVDIAAAVILAIATVATAWCAYQATRWGGVQATLYAEASSARIESTRQANLAFQTLSIDANLFTDWVMAYSDGDTELQSFYETNLMRPAFLPYLEEWVASDPLHNENSLQNPIVNPTYQQGLMAESARYRAEAEAKFDEAAHANQTGDEYILATVTFASVLFFAGISNKFERVRIQGALVALAGLMLVVGFIQFGTLPIE